MRVRHRGRRVLTPREALVRYLAAAIALALLLLGAYAVARRLETARYTEELGEMSSGFGTLPTVTYQGDTYELKPGNTSVLFIGADKDEGAQRYGFRQGGQADFLLLVLFDHNAKAVRQLHIDRDTMTDAVVLGAFGNEVGTQRMQVCLSHGFGATPQDNCAYTLKAVQNLLQGMTVDFYMALDLAGIGVLNNAVGGVEVTVQDDLTALDPQLTPGRTLRLTDAQAEVFLRARMSVGDGTNISRMRRQRAYLLSLSAALRQGIGRDADFVGTLFDALSGVTVQNISRGRLMNEANRSYNYDILPVETLAGEYRIGADGFVEFIADQDALMTWILNAFYNRKE